MKVIYFLKTLETVKFLSNCDQNSLTYKQLHAHTKHSLGAIGTMTKIATQETFQTTYPARSRTITFDRARLPH